jgi:predicted permease
VVLFTVCAALVTGLLFGLVPALQFGRADLHTGLRVRGMRTGQRVRSLLVVAEVTIALVSLMGAALLIRTLMALRSVDPGFDPRGVVATLVTLDPRFARTADVDGIGEDIFRRVRALPGVEQAALTGMLPLEGGFNSLTITIPGRPLDGLSHGNARWMTVSAAYFDTLRIPLLRGRLFSDADRRGSPPVAIVNQAMARQFWPDGDPLRDQLVIGQGLGQNFGEPPRQVVGIVGDVREDALGAQPTPAVFIPSTQRANRVTSDPRTVMKMWVVVRTHGESAPLDRAIEKELRQASGGLPVAPLRRMEDVVTRSTASQQLNMILMTVFGGFSVLLAAIGIYGLLANSVQQRAREMAIRVALGALPGDVRNMVVREGMRLTLAGAALGTAAATGLTRFLASLLFGVKALDTVTFVAAPILLIAVALAATWLPARRASHVDPAEALRSE